MIRDYRDQPICLKIARVRESVIVKGLHSSQCYQCQSTYQLVQLSLCPTRYNWNHHSQPTRDVQILKMPPMLCHRWCYRVNTLPIPDQHGYRTDDMLRHQNQLQMQIHWERTVEKGKRKCVRWKHRRNHNLALTVTALISLSCPGNVCLHCPSRISHNLAEASHAPDTNALQWGDNDRAMTSPVWPKNDVHCWPVSISHKPHDMSPELVTICDAAWVCCEKKREKAFCVN